MSDRIVIPEEMRFAALKAVAEKHEVTSIGAMAASWADDADCAVEAALRWQSENPRVPTGQQLWEMSTKGPLADVNFVCAEWQRRMYLVPEPEVPEGTADLHWPGGLLGMGLGDTHNEQVDEAYRRGQKISPKNPERL